MLDDAAVSRFESHGRELRGRGAACPFQVDLLSTNHTCLLFSSRSVTKKVRNVSAGYREENVRQQNSSPNLDHCVALNRAGRQDIACIRCGSRTMCEELWMGEDSRSEIVVHQEYHKLLTALICLRTVLLSSGTLYQS